MFTRLHKAGLKVNGRKSCFGAYEFDHSGYPIRKKVEAIQALTVPKNCKKLHRFIGMIKFYRDIWQNCSDLPDPLTALISKNVKYDWKDEHQKCFDAIKRVIEREVLLA